MITGLHTIWAPVHEMDAAVRFYEEVLGLSKGHASPFWTEFLVGDRKIALHAGGEPGTAGWVLGLTTDDLDALEHRLREAGATVIGRHETPSGELLDFRDPDGNKIQAIKPN
jgi:predicted enzyme related to lactoylglutathione lyase